MELTFASPTIEQLRRQLQDAQQIDFAFLFGSYADGTNNDLSDIDIAVHFRGEYTLLDVGEITTLLEKTCVTYEASHKIFPTETRRMLRWILCAVVAEALLFVA